MKQLLSTWGQMYKMYNTNTVIQNTTIKIEHIL